MDEREWITRYVDRMMELHRLAPQPGQALPEARRFAQESARGAYPALKDEDPAEVADAEFDEGRSNTRFLEAY
ncbi:hypothetical protein EJV46_14015 [Roseococcus sp. SYP-B2431]|uniref:hypothetical protein n=1 Tax=Roseococcus sp. SYP-B2431 TaxID=2496640 RepID=UPI001038EA23|nr:hypothetical protein [Roseococcus sp. SYP-B2431]TCH98296.1 hypothetical protein EJV46_14015 [Roseococcus sp. SYP-B2431]